MLWDNIIELLVFYRHSLPEILIHITNLGSVSIRKTYAKYVKNDSIKKFDLSIHYLLIGFPRCLSYMGLENMGYF